MTNLIYKVIGGIRCAYEWDQAKRQASIGNYHKALLRLKAFEAIRSLPSDMKLLKAFLLYRTDKPKESLDVFQEAWEEIREDKDLSADDINYLKGYINVFISEAGSFGYNSSLTLDIDIEDINLEAVSKRLKTLYPLVEHPRWRRPTVPPGSL